MKKIKRGGGFFDFPCKRNTTTSAEHRSSNGNGNGIGNGSDNGIGNGIGNGFNSEDPLQKGQDTTANTGDEDDMSIADSNDLNDADDQDDTPITVDDLKIPTWERSKTSIDFDSLTKPSKVVRAYETKPSSDQGQPLGQDQPQEQAPKKDQGQSGGRRRKLRGGNPNNMKVFLQLASPEHRHMFAMLFHPTKYENVLKIMSKIHCAYKINPDGFKCDGCKTEENNGQPWYEYVNQVKAEQTDCTDYLRLIQLPQPLKKFEEHIYKQIAEFSKLMKKPLETIENTYKQVYDPDTNYVFDICDFLESAHKAEQPSGKQFPCGYVDEPLIQFTRQLSDKNENVFKAFANWLDACFAQLIEYVGYCPVIVNALIRLRIEYEMSLNHYDELSKLITPAVPKQFAGVFKEEAKKTDRYQEMKSIMEQYLDPCNGFISLQSLSEFKLQSYQVPEQDLDIYFKNIKAFIEPFFVGLLPDDQQTARSKAKADADQVNKELAVEPIEWENVDQSVKNNINKSMFIDFINEGNEEALKSSVQNAIKSSNHKTSITLVHDECFTSSELFGPPPTVNAVRQYDTVVPNEKQLMMIAVAENKHTNHRTLYYFDIYTDVLQLAKDRAHFDNKEQLTSDEIKKWLEDELWNIINAEFKMSIPISQKYSTPIHFELKHFGPHTPDELKNRIINLLTAEIKDKGTRCKPANTNGEDDPAAQTPNDDQSKNTVQTGGKRKCRRRKLIKV